jgi:hypothetical protein
MKGVILITPRVRRLALAVLAGVFFGVVGVAVASANADTPSGSSADTSQTTQLPDKDWW